MCDRGKLGNGLDDAGLVIREHDANQFCVRADGGLQGGWFDEALRSAGEAGYFYVLFCEGFRSAQDGVVLDAGGDEVSGFRCTFHGSEESEIIAFGATGGEDDLGGAAMEDAGDGVAGVVDGRASVLALLVDGAGVAVVLQKERTHGLEDFGEKRRGGIRVHVDTAHTLILPLARIWWRKGLLAERLYFLCCGLSFQETAELCLASDSDKILNWGAQICLFRALKGGSSDLSAKVLKICVCFGSGALLAAVSRQS